MYGYDVESILGSGGYGDVLKVRMEKTNEKFALKRFKVTAISYENEI